uniref:Uncharacterized protein n=1 Tax=Arundo donax TaxID=35708 RepID=A0A0A9TCF0_ARUDO
MHPMMHYGAPPEYLAHSHQVPGLMGSWNGIEEHGMLLTKGYDRAGTRLFPYSWNGDVVPGMRNTEQCAICEMWNSMVRQNWGVLHRSHG